MTKKVWEQTADDMDERYGSGGFQAAGGNMQSLTFAFSALSHLLQDDKLYESLKPLSDWTSERLSDNTLRVDGLRGIIYDLGCAEGDGTAALSYLFPLSHITGIDISPVAIERARIRWPHLNFEVGDITEPDIDIASIIFSSHTIEHLEHPAEVVLDLLSRCSILIVIVPPITEEQIGDTHVSAVPLAEWLKKVPTPYYTTSYNTLRPDLESKRAIVEGNTLLVWKGEK